MAFVSRVAGKGTGEVGVLYADQEYRDGKNVPMRAL